MLAYQQADELLIGARQLGVNLTVNQHKLLLGYLAILIKWNKVYNLTAVRNPEQMVSRHLLDSLSVMPFIKNGHWLDVGSGAGIPGIPLAILCPCLQVTCLDSNGKKARFMTQVKLQLKLENLQVLHNQVKKITPELSFNGIIARAFSSLVNFINWTRYLGDLDTHWLAMKGVYPNDELLALPSDFYLHSKYVLAVPGFLGQRHLLVLRRTA
ncbi:16S rRNA (guanine(527)-N(7))-methyltransferase RsmG [Candidatus Pseudomonas adelgestsugas]